MTPEQWQQVKQLFLRLLELESSQEDIYLDQNCPDEEVRREVKSLVANHRKADNFLDQKAYKTTASVTNLSMHGDLDNEKFFNNMIGKKFNNTYLIEEKIGSGGMGAVFRCTHLLLGNQVAIKVMSPSIINDSDYLKRFRREARVGWQLSHPNIIKVLEFSQTQEGLFFLVMEYVKGTTLKSYIQESAPMPLARVIEIIEPVCNALETTHNRKILHRDLKPANILISKEGDEEVIKLSDFGIIKLLERDSQITEGGTTITGDGTVMGTVNYMAPEQLMNYKLTPASDIYSLGVIIYEMLTGELPIAAPSSYQTIMAKTKVNRIDAPSVKYPFLPKMLDEVLQKALAGVPQERYQKASELLKALKSIGASVSAN